MKTRILTVLIVIVAFLLGFAGWYFFQRNRPATAPSTNTTNAATNTATTAVVPAAPQQAADQDRDGLTDQEEATLGTNPNSSDTDSDGLPDRAEVQVYKSNPLVADSDKDGVTDGDEVKAGTNPNGPGVLLDVSKAIEALNATTTP